MPRDQVGEPPEDSGSVAEAVTPAGRFTLNRANLNELEPRRKGTN